MPSNPLAIAASQGQRESALLITARRSLASTPTSLALAPATGMKRVAQIARVGSVHAENGALDIFHCSHVHFVGKDVAERNETGQFIQKLGRLHLTDALDQNFAVNRRSGKPHCLKKRDLASAQIDLAMHTIL